MSMSALVRALGSVAQGVSTGMDQAEAKAERERKRKQEDEDRAYTMQERARLTADRDRADKLRADVGNAAMPTAVETAPVAMPIGSRDEPRAPEDMGIRAAGQTFADIPTATKAAADYNSPQAIANRQAALTAQAGDPHAAQQLRTGAMQEQIGKLQLSAAERADVAAKFNDDLQSRVNSWDTLGQFMSESAGDGQGGAVKFATAVSPDGKMRTLNKIGPNGEMVPTGHAFPNTADGLALAKAELSKLPAEKMLLHLHQKEQDRRAAAAQEATEKHQAGMLGVAQASQASTAQHQRATEAHQARMLAAAQAKAAAGATPQGMTFADLKDGHKTIASTLNADWKTQIDAETDPVKLKAIKVARESETAATQRLYTGAMSAGFALTPEQAIVAFRTGEAATQAFKSRDGGTVKVNGVMYGGRFIPMADNPGAAAGTAEKAAPAAAGGKPAPAKPAAAIPVDPSVQAPPAAPEPPGMLDRVKGVVAAGQEQGREMEAIRARVNEADAGGKSLTAAERATAKKYAIWPTR